MATLKNARRTSSYQSGATYTMKAQVELKRSPAARGLYPPPRFLVLISSWDSPLSSDGTPCADLFHTGLVMLAYLDMVTIAFGMVGMRLWKALTNTQYGQVRLGSK